MVFKLELMREGRRTLWCGVIDKETGDYLTISSVHGENELIEFELHYRGYVFQALTVEKRISRRKEGEIGRVPSIAIHTVKEILAPLACNISEEEIKKVFIEAIEVYGVPSLDPINNGGGEVLFSSNYRFQQQENIRIKSKSPNEIKNNNNLV